MMRVITLALLVLFAFGHTNWAQNCNLWDEDIGSIILSGNDDGSVGPINLPFPVPVYGNIYTRFWINNNGNVTFTGSLSTFTSFAFPNNRGIVIVAPFFADVDTRPANSGKVHYKVTNDYILITWNNVGYYSNHTDKKNRFQLVITRDGYAGFSYANMEWTTGDASGGANGFGGSVARAGFDAGDGQNALVFWSGNTPESLEQLRCRTFWYNLRTGLPTEDRYPPDTLITEGPSDGSLVCQEPVRFRWTGTDDATLPQDLVFRWRLNGGDWSEWTSQTSIELTGLSEGEHTFEVQARDGAQRVDETPASLTFRYRNDTTAPQISNLQVDAQVDRATISWETDEPATSAIEYRRQGTNDWTRTEVRNELDTSHSITLTSLVGHETYEYRVEVRDECGNQYTSEIATFTVRAADLRVALVQAPEDIWDDTPFDITWRVENHGDLSAQNWKDRIYFSRDDRIDSSDRVIGEFPFAGSLAAGESAVRTQTVSVPRSWINPEGTYYLIVFTDSGNAVKEGVREDNNTLSRAVSARLVPLPDLTVPQVQAPSTAFFDQIVEVRWQVQNAGEGATSGGWYDRVMLSNENSVVAYWEFANESALAGGEGYSARHSIRIPRGLVGRHYLTVATDTGNRVLESDEGNNRSTAIPIDIQVPPLPDLVVPQVQAPDQSFAGQRILARWRVENRGARDIPANERSWADALYLSTDTSLSGDDRRIGSRAFRGNLQPGEGYSVVDYEVTIPRDLPAGNYYLLVKTDARNSVYEFTNESNNVGASAQPIEILANPPNIVDLVVDSVQAPTTGQAGNTITVQWRVLNQGVDPAPAPWIDAVYLSTTPTFNRSEATQLASTVYRSDLPGGEYYEQTLEIRLPDCLPAGQYYLFVVTDETDGVVEYDPSHDAEQNNVSMPVTIRTTLTTVDLVVPSVFAPTQAVSGTQIRVEWEVRNVGDRTTPVSQWEDRIFLTRADGTVVRELGRFPHSGALEPGDKYTGFAVVSLPPNLQGEFRIVVETDANNRVVECNAENNNRQSASIQLSYGDLPNLQVSGVTISQNTAQSLQTITVNWRVQNTGTAGASGWTDGIYLSSTPSLAGANLLRRSPAPSGLSPNSSYDTNAMVTIPIVPPGQYYVLVVADDTGHIFEGENEQDNIAYVYPLEISRPSVDLTVEAVSAPSEATAGFPVEIVWTIRNQGSDATYVGWNDTVVLSRDTILDASDPRIGGFQHTNPLGAGESRAVRLTMTIPSSLTGPYYVFVITDSSNGLPELDEANNVAMSAGSMVVTLAPPADLVVEQVSAPTTGSPGTPTTISWIARNSGSNNARGGWYDSVYLSRDQQWNLDDELIGRFEHHQDLAPGESYTGQLTATLPGVLPGNYYIIVRTDARNNVRETDDTNNSGVSAPITLDVTELQLGVPFSNTFSPSAQSHYYKVNVPANQTVLWTLDSAVDSATTEMFVRYNAMAERSAYDYRNELPFGADQEVVVPRSQAGYYFGLLYGAEISGNTQYQTKVEILPFGIRELVPSIAGNNGLVSMKIRGAQFEDVEQAFIVLPGGVRRYAAAVSVVSPSEVRAIFNLKGLTPGSYTVGVRTATGAEALSSEGLTVVEEPSSEPPLIVRVSGPDTIRSGASATYYITIYNAGRNDAIGTILSLRIPAGTPYSLPTLLLPDDLEEDVQHHADLDDGRYLMLMVPVVPANDSVTIPIRVTDVRGGVMSVQAIVLGSLPAYVVRPDGLFSIPVDSCWASVLNALLECLSAIPAVGDLIRAVLRSGECIFNLIKGIYQKIVAGVNLGKDFSFSTVLSLALEMAKFVVSLLESCAGVVTGITPILGHILGAISCVNSIVDAYTNCSRDDQKDSPVVVPMDPNEKHSPSGYADQRYVPKNAPIAYTVLFENLPTAGAYANQVAITDQLDSDLDWRTFELETISFRGGRYTVQVPPGQRFYQTTVQMSENDGGLQVRILAGIDLNTGVVTWRLTAIDPNTGEPPTNPLMGLLPPNNESHEGEGYVTFRVKPKRTVTTGTVITNSATIVFDTEEPLTTNEVFNTIDANPPVSTVRPLPQVTRNSQVAVSWSGEDDASGLKEYNVWVSVDGSAYTLWMANTTATSATYPVEFGHTYAFYATATDNAGNLEQAPSSPEASVQAFTGDVNLDGCVDDTDLLLILLAFGEQGQNLTADITEDGVVDDADMNLVLFNFGQGCQ